MLQNIWEGINPYIIQIIGVLLTSLAGYLGLKFKTLYENKINTETKKDIVKMVVEMVEQVSKKYNWTSEQKLEQAKETIIQLLADVKIKITDLELEAMIESIVNSFNNKKASQN